jgi:hypothetical protein
MSVTAQFSEILTAFGQKIGIPQIVFDDEGQCCLGFDDMTVNIELNQDGTQIIVSSELTTLTERPSETLMLRYLALNHIALLSGTGGLGFDESTRQLFFVERISLHGLDDDLFELSMANAVGRIEALRDMFMSADWNALATDTMLDSTALMARFISSKF